MNRTPKITSTVSQNNSFLGGRRQVILDTSTTNGDVYLVQGIMPAGSVVPVHVHELEDEIFHVLEGEVELILGETTINGKKGDIIYLPRGIKHGIRTIGTKTAKVLNYVIPGKNFEAFFDKMNRIGLDASVEEKKKIAIKHQIRFL